MKNILIINSGGTFNKIYNRVSGNLEIDKNSLALKEIEQKWLTKLNFINIINKDSLDFLQEDRELLARSIKYSPKNKIVVIHGTDTIDISAKYVDSLKLDKVVVFTGAMVPFSINPIEATANLALALAYAKFASNGVYIALNGIIDNYKKVIKDKSKGKFITLT